MPGVAALEDAAEALEDGATPLVAPMDELEEGATPLVAPMEDLEEGATPLVAPADELEEGRVPLVTAALLEDATTTPLEAEEAPLAEEALVAADALEGPGEVLDDGCTPLEEPALGVGEQCESAPQV